MRSFVLNKVQNATHQDQGSGLISTRTARSLVSKLISSNSFGLRHQRRHNRVRMHTPLQIKMNFKLFLQRHSKLYFDYSGPIILHHSCCYKIMAHVLVAIEMNFEAFTYSETSTGECCSKY